MIMTFKNYFSYIENDFNEFVHVDHILVSVEFLDDDAIVAFVSSIVEIVDNIEKDRICV